jgi:cholesterol transport system auxiliary component
VRLAHRLTASLFVAFSASAGLRCISLDLKKPDPVNLYRLDAVATPPAADGRDPPAALAGSVAISVPRARPGFESPRLVYVSKAHQLQSFARSEWVDTPSRMLAPLLVEALERSGRFQSVGPSPEIAARFRLETEIAQLQQEFTVHPSQARFTLDVRLLDVTGRRVLVRRELEAVEPAPSDDAYGGVVAENRAVQRVLQEVVAFCVNAAAAARIHEDEPPVEEHRQGPPTKEPSATFPPISDLRR